MPSVGLKKRLLYPLLLNKEMEERLKGGKGQDRGFPDTLILADYILI
jgi:hypothetical protein